MLESGVSDSVLPLVKQWLEGPQSGKWLLILDNADDYDLLYGPTRHIDYLPSCKNGSVLMTTRNNKVAVDFAPSAGIIEVTPFDKHEVHLFFSNRFGSDRSVDESVAYWKLATELENLPLALTQAAAFILGNRISIQEYLVLFVVELPVFIRFLFTLSDC